MSRNAIFPVLSLALCLTCFVSCTHTSFFALKTEHIALDVASPEQTAEWWCKHLGFNIVVKQTAPPFAIFIREHQGQFALELYRAENTQQAPDYHNANPLQFHIAFLSTDLDKDIARLMDAGATLVSRQTVLGSELVMLRDPSGIPIQLVQRQQPILE